jgi:RNA polymerase sigma-70 factor (ECF subfamily)
MSEEPQRQGWCEPLYRDEAPALVLYGRALGLSHAEAEDVLQETFVALLRMTDEPAEARHYVIRAFRNRALNFRRGWWRHLTRELESVRWFERDPEETPHEREAMRCLAGLPPEQREVIVLKIWQGMTYETIGQLAGISPHTAAGRYRYGIARLRACLRGEPQNETDELSQPGRNRESTGFLEAPASLTGG